MKNTSIIFIDSSVINYKILLQAFVSRLEAVILNRHQDGVEQITQVLSQRRGVESVHIISHGSPGCLYLGNTQLSLSTLQRYTQELQTWSSHLCVSPSLFLYGCNVAAGDAGEEFIDKLHKLTKASIAASGNLTGNAALGGDWKLEISRGEVTTTQVFKPEILKTYNFVLASSNDNFANRIVLSGNSGSSTGNNVGATSESGEPIQSGTTNSVWWSWTAPASGNVIFNTTGSSFDTYLDVYTGNAVNSLTLVAANDDIASGNLASQVSFAVTAGTTYYISVDGYQTSTGNITLNYSFTSGASASNTAPTLTDTVVTLNSINEDPDAPSGAVGTLVSSLVGLGRNVNDSNSGAVTGIAITTANTSNGSWWYSTNNGQNWFSLGTVSNSSARLLAADSNTRVYFRSSSNFNGIINNAFTFRAWDQTSGTNGGLANASTNGGSSAFSSTTDTAAITINAVNDAPVITPINALSLPDNASNGTILRTLTATDVDSNTTFSNWAIASGNIDTDGDGNQAFSINPNTGQLAINDIDDLNPQSNPSVNLQVNVSDGIVTSANQNVTIKLLLNPGDIDLNFGNGGMVSTKFGNGGSAYSVAIQPDGKILAVGYVYMYNNNVSSPDFALARYNPDGSLDTGFGNGGTVTTHVVGTSSDFGYDLTLQTDGKIIVAGYTWGDSSQPNQPDFALARYNADGSLDSTFGNGGKVITNFGEDFGHNVLLQSDGKIILAGYIGNGNADYVLVRYNTNGSLDTSFGNDGKVNGTKGYAVAIQSDGKIVVGGKDSNGSDIKFALTRYNTDGSLDTSFGNSGIVAAIGTPGGEIHNIAIQSDGKIVVTGRVWKYVNGSSSNQDDLAIARFNTDGALDTNFGDGGKVITPLSASTSDRANSLSIQPNGKIVVAGYVESGTNSLNRTTVLLAYNSDGTIDSNFGTGGQVTTSIKSKYDETDVITTQLDGKIVVVGNLDGYFAVARYLGVDDGDRLYGTAADDYLYGSNGNDDLYGNNGNDNLIGGAANDNLSGGAGDDILDGGDGIDSLTESSDVNFTLSDTQLFGLGSDTLTSIERVTLTGGISDNILDASGFSLGSVFLYGDAGNDTINGGASDDYLYGQEGSDRLIGGVGNDYLYGGNGNDLLNGGAGNDHLYGQVGADIFLLASGNGTDTIYSFEDGIDKLGLFGGLTYGALTISANGNNTSIRITSTNEVLATLTTINSSLIGENDFVAFS